GDPGLQYDGAIQKWHTCKGTEPIHSTNPCSEYVFLNNTACNLASLNLMKFKKADGRFDVERFKAAVRIYITAQEILVDNASYPTQRIAENSHIFRTLGLGYANLGSLIMSYGLAYDSDEGRALAGALTAIMTGHAYEQSAEMSAIQGAFPGYHDASCGGVPKTAAKDNVASTLGVVQQHREAVEGIQASREFAYLKDEARRTWDRAIARGREVGYRNAQVTVLAPTGTIAFLMDCDTTGVEPDIALVKYKLLAGGGMLKIVNRTVPEALQRLGYSAGAIAAIEKHIEVHDTIEDVVGDGGAIIASGLKPEHLPVFDCAFKPFKGQRSIHYKAHLSMMGAAQPFISGAISKTVNMPNDATTADIRNAYVDAWKMGLKCVAI
ncbi:MAG: vitamin B12-dependent ribonucleotide reductase, partial [Verrucomicrobiota bacterium]